MKKSTITYGYFETEKEFVLSTDGSFIINLNHPEHESYEQLLRALLAIDTELLRQMVDNFEVEWMLISACMQADKAANAKEIIRSLLRTEQKRRNVSAWKSNAAN